MASGEVHGGPGPGLYHLAVRNFAIIDDQAIDFGDGMTVLTGETGAGKSLLVDALNIVLGERASSDLVQAGARAAEVSASFEAGPQASAWLAEHALDDEDRLCSLRRAIGADGRSRAFINGRAVAVSQLRDLGSLLVDVHGQHAHQSLLKSEVQRQILDDYGEHHELLETLSGCHQALRDVEAEITRLQTPAADLGPRMDYLRYQIDELQGQALSAQDFASLSNEHRRLSHGSELIEVLASVLDSLDDQAQSAATRIADALNRLESLKRLDPQLDEFVQTLSEAQAILAESIHGLRRYADELDPDTSSLEALEQRLGALEDLARKHNCRAEALQDRLLALQDELEALETAGERLNTARAEHSRLLAQYRECAAELHQRRTASGRRLGKAVNRQLARLGLEQARLEIHLLPMAEDQHSAHGRDRIEFQICTNPGQPPRTLARIASGGELSRIGLALQAVAIGDSGVPTIVFDEVDAGIGGRVAEIVGQLMRDLGRHRQVLTVTHLPQVASLAHHHIRVTKLNDKSSSRTLLRDLDRNQRVDEIARMLAGVEVTDKSRAHAREMLASAVERPTGTRKTNA